MESRTSTNTPKLLSQPADVLRGPLISFYCVLNVYGLRVQKHPRYITAHRLCVCVTLQANNRTWRHSYASWLVSPYLHGRVSACTADIGAWCGRVSAWPLSHVPGAMGSRPQTWSPRVSNAVLSTAVCVRVCTMWKGLYSIIDLIKHCLNLIAILCIGFEPLDK